MSFVHLHLHTEYSLLDGLIRTEPLLKKVKKDKMPSVAITDHGVLYGIAEFWTNAKEIGVKPIIGCEMYISPKKHTIKKEENGIKYYHIILLAKNKTGYLNLNKIASIGALEGFYYKPRIDLQTLEKYSEGLICTSACIGGPLGRHIIRKQYKKVNEMLENLKKIFKHDFYLEICRNGYKNSDTWENKIGENLSDFNIDYIKKQMKVNKKLIELSNKTKTKLIATTDAHYLDKEDAVLQDILFCVRENKLLSDNNRMKSYIDTYVKTTQEMQDHFQDIPKALENTLEIDEKIDTYDIRFNRIQPHYIPVNDYEKKLSAQELLKDKVMQGAKKMYPKVDNKLIKRIDMELEVIHNKGYDDYFLVVADMINWARSQGMIVGVRGSVAGSVVAYCLGIVNVEPIEWELYFERFLNPERPSPPDIDIDLQDDRRDEVIEYIESKYGKENIAAICAIGRMKTKAAIRDVARVMDIDLKIADKLSKKVHVVFGKVKPIEKMINDDPEFAEIINSDPKLQKLKKYVSKIEGIARHISTHACGYLVTPKPITEYVAVQYEKGKNNQKIITQEEGAWIEALGLMKFDFLGLRNYTILNNTFKLIKKYYNKKITVDDIPRDDKKTFELFGQGNTIGVFQFESPPMQKYLMQLKPETLEDLCFMTAAYRPGPMKYIPEYIKCRHGLKKPEYLIPEMKPILKNTYGFAIYQEQVIRIAVDIAGYSMGDADLLRRAIGKKKLKIMKKEEKKFKKGVMKKKYSQEIANKLWDYLLPFADYGFNKAHGATYAVLSYWCAYLKTHYPIEFMTALMHSDLTDQDRISIDMQEAKKLGFDILAPNINKSEKYFTIEGKSKIRFGLGAIKNVGLGLVEDIVKERKENGDFVNIDDFVYRIIENQNSKINKSSLEALIKVGCFDKMGMRNQFITILPNVLEKASKQQKTKKMGQTDIFNFSTTKKSNKIQSSIDKTELPKLEDFNDIKKTKWEKELIGTYISAHPLDNYLDLINSKTVYPISFLDVDLSNKESIEFIDPISENKLKNEKNIKFIGIVSNIKTVYTKKDNKQMGILEIEDHISKASAVIFPKKYQNLKNEIIEGEVYVFYGNVSERDNKYNLIINKLSNPNNFNSPNKLNIDLSNEHKRKKIENIKEIIKANTFDKSSQTKTKNKKLKLNIKYGDKNNLKKFSIIVKKNNEIIKSLKEYID